ncbi:hypothetical protein D5R40_08030 [Okeania hirsuta]|uniref:Uncharacterized protein n=1 Tax=Okeania hirsuta TaxID=1458930 RepID=A0A3N6NFI5_9CYAN|nr:hypothetical protein D4Z78_22150 [Okeania hirsuta]RQH48243.1 hypothetical protein D5R40_08030 [Okeania hirsuta]
MRLIYNFYSFPVACCLLPVACCLFPIPYSLFPIPYSLFPIPYSLFPITYSLKHKTLYLINWKTAVCLIMKRQKN